MFTFLDSARLGPLNFRFLHEPEFKNIIIEPEIKGLVRVYELYENIRDQRLKGAARALSKQLNTQVRSQCETFKSPHPWLTNVPHYFQWETIPS